MFAGKFFKNHELKTLKEDARKFQAHGQYAKAAENYIRIASAYLEEYPLIYATHCHEAFRQWLKAKNSEKALEQARAVLHNLDDTGWLKQDMEEVLDLKLTSDEFKDTDFESEVSTFAGELNKKLEEFGLML